MDSIALEKSILSAILSAVVFVNKVHVFGCICVTIDGRDSESVTVKLNKFMGQVDKHLSRDKHIEDSLNKLRSKHRKRSNSVDSKLIPSDENRNIPIETSAFRRSHSTDGKPAVANTAAEMKPKAIVSNKPKTRVTLVSPISRSCHGNLNGGFSGSVIQENFDAMTVDPKQRLVLERSLKEFLKLKYQQKLHSKSPAPDASLSPSLKASPVPPELIKLLSLQARIMGVPLPSEFTVANEKRDGAPEQVPIDASASALNSANWSDLLRDVGVREPVGISELVLSKKSLSGAHTHEHGWESNQGSAGSSDSVTQDLGITKQKRLSFTGSSDKYTLEEGAFAKAMHKKLGIIKAKSFDDKLDTPVTKRKSLFRNGSIEKRKEFVSQMLEKSASKRAHSACMGVRNLPPSESLVLLNRNTIGSGSGLHSVELSMQVPREVTSTSTVPKHESNSSNNFTNNDVNLNKDFVVDNAVSSLSHELYTFKPIDMSPTEPHFPSPTLRTSETFPSQESSSTSDEFIQETIKSEKENLIESDSKVITDTDSHINGEKLLENLPMRIENRLDNASVAMHPFVPHDSIRSLMQEESDSEQAICASVEKFILPFSDIDTIPDLPVMKTRKQRHSVTEYKTKTTENILDSLGNSDKILKSTNIGKVEQHECIVDTGLSLDCMNERVIDIQEDSNTSFTSVGSSGFETTSNEANQNLCLSVKQDENKICTNTSGANLHSSKVSSNRKRKSTPSKLSARKIKRKESDFQMVKFKRNVCLDDSANMKIVQRCGEANSNCTEETSIENSESMNSFKQYVSTVRKTEDQKVAKLKLTLKRVYADNEQDSTSKDCLSNASTEWTSNAADNRQTTDALTDKIRRSESLDMISTHSEKHAKRIKYDMSVLKKVSPVQDYRICPEFSDTKRDATAGANGQMAHSKNSDKLNIGESGCQKNVSKARDMVKDNVRKNAYRSLPIISKNNLEIFLSAKNAISKRSKANAIVSPIGGSEHLSNCTNTSTTSSVVQPKAASQGVQTKAHCLHRPSQIKSITCSGLNAQMGKVKDCQTNADSKAQNDRLEAKERAACDKNETVSCDNGQALSTSQLQVLNTLDHDKDITKLAANGVANYHKRETTLSQPSSSSFRTSPYGHLLVPPIPTVYSCQAQRKLKVSPKTVKRISLDERPQSLASLSSPILSIENQPKYDVQISNGAQKEIVKTCDSLSATVEHSVICDKAGLLNLEPDGRNNQIERSAKMTISSRSATDADVPINSYELISNRSDSLVTRKQTSLLPVAPIDLALELERGKDVVKLNDNKNTCDAVLTNNLATTGQISKTEKISSFHVKFSGNHGNLNKENSGRENIENSQCGENLLDLKSKCSRPKSKRKKHKKKSKKSDVNLLNVPLDNQCLPPESGRADKTKGADRQDVDQSGFKIKKYWCDMYSPANSLTTLK